MQTAVSEPRMPLGVAVLLGSVTHTHTAPPPPRRSTEASAARASPRLQFTLRTWKGANDNGKLSLGLESY